MYLAAIRSPGMDSHRAHDRWSVCTTQFSGNQRRSGQLSYGACGFVKSVSQDLLGESLSVYTLKDAS